MSEGGTKIEAWRAPHFLALASLCLLGLGLLAAGPSVDRAVAGGCNHAGAGISDARAKQLARAVFCLINDHRVDRDIRRLDPSAKLGKAAARHNRAMLKQNCWKHDCPGEPALERRIRDTGYLQGARTWRFAENFGCEVTPQVMVDSWLEKSFSRSNIRDRGFRDVGVAAVKDQVGRSRCDDGNEVTYTAVFALRRG